MGVEHLSMNKFPGIIITSFISMSTWYTWWPGENMRATIDYVKYRNTIDMDRKRACQLVAMNY